MGDKTTKRKNNKTNNKINDAFNTPKTLFLLVRLREDRTICASAIEQHSTIGEKQNSNLALYSPHSKVKPIGHRQFHMTQRNHRINVTNYPDVKSVYKMIAKLMNVQ